MKDDAQCLGLDDESDIKSNFLAEFKKSGVGFNQFDAGLISSMQRICFIVSIMQ